MAHMEVVGSGLGIRVSWSQDSSLKFGDQHPPSNAPREGNQIKLRSLRLNISLSIPTIYPIL